MRLLLFTLALPSVIVAQDALDILRRATEIDRKNLEIARSYTYLERQEQRDLGSDGKVKKTESTITDVTLLEGSPFRRTVARNDKPLPPKEQRKEEERLQKSIEDRRKETPEERTYRISEWERKQQKQRDALKELPDAFTFKLAGEEVVNGGGAYVLEGMPKPGYRPTNATSSIFPKIKVKMWIDKKDYRWVRIDLESLDTISFGGILVRVAKGTRARIETARINNEVWLPKSAEVRGSVRIALLKLVRAEIIFTYYGYKKFQSDSRIITQ